MAEKFVPVLRFMVVSDVHYKDEPSPERERMAKALKTAYALADKHESYNNLDAVVVVGDFATAGTEIQMQAFKKTLDDNLRKDKTKTILPIASHEFKSAGEAAAFEKLKRIFDKDEFDHQVINGFHLISLSTTNGTNFADRHIEWLSENLQIAADDNPKKPIFVFQHPHLQATVSGSINWGDDALITTMMNYPQIIDFSGHSHAPINDPRSIYQEHFTCLGTGTLSYFELDEFDKIYGTVPPNNKNAAQMLIVEADEQNRVRIYPYDLISGNFFPYVWKIDKAYDPSSFLYTDKIRYSNPAVPYFEKGTKIELNDIGENSVKLTFGQAKIDEDYVNGYEITVRYKESGLIAKKIAIWSEYYFYNMPSELTQEISGLKSSTEYTVEVTANSFWKTVSEDKLTGSFKTK